MITRRFIRKIQYQYYNDPRLASKLNEHNMTIDSYIIQVILNPEIARTYRQQYRLWRQELRLQTRALKTQISALEAKTAAINANVAQMERDYANQK